MSRPSHDVVVRRVDASAVRPLRQQVLRPHQRVEDLVYPYDDEPDTGHYAAVAAGGAVVAIATVHREPPPWDRAVPDGWRLRGMATTPATRGTGLGRRILDAAVQHVAATGGGLLWCNARTTARGFYERAGFGVIGDPWDEPDLGPHVRMWRLVTRSVR